MILFIIKKTEIATLGRYLIPLHYPMGQSAIGSELNVWFISWDEADYKLKDGTTVQITHIDILKQAVYDAAIRDETVCKEMGNQFLQQYGIDIWDLWNKPNDPAYHIIGDVFAQWAHPMIGNVVVSSGIRPQTSGDQYMKNWDFFPEDYMAAHTKTAIKKLIDESLLYDPELEPASPAGLRRIAKSSRDQVRCCKDMTELARAVIGEITTYATRKLEKIYALELCNSDKFLMAQKEFIKCVVIERSEEKIAVNQKLQNLFLHCDSNPIKVTDYIYFYFPKLSDLEKNEQWIAFIYLLNAYLGSGCAIPCDRPADEGTAGILYISASHTRGHDYQCYTEI